MEHVCSSRQDEYLFIDPNIENMMIHDHVLNSSHEQEPPLFLDFPSPFFDAISTTPIHTNNHTNPYHITSQTKTVDIDPSPSESKRVKKRSGAKKDRHSKIHTAQGLRDRRMRLSLNIAQKFFNLQDLLGFDKASNTIEWLFCKSNKAIKEVAKNFSTQHTNQSMSVENENTEPRMKRMPNNSTVRETRDQARARARDRTRERQMKKEDEKSKLVFARNPNEEISKLGLGYLSNPNNQNAGELGFISSPSELIIPQETSSSMNNLNNSFVNYSAGSVVDTLINHNPPAGWLNSWNGFLPVEWDIADSEYYNYGIVPSTTVSLTDDMYEQNPSLFMMSSTTNILHQNQGK